MMKRTLLSLAFVAIAGSLGIAQSSTHYVSIVLTLPNGGHPELVIREGGTGSMEVPNGIKWGFVPTVKSGSTGTVDIDIMDLRQTPAKKLETVETSVHGHPVSTKSNPQISVHVVEIGTR